MRTIAIAALRGGEDNAPRYRCLHFEEQLCLAGGIPTWVSTVGDVAPHAASGLDVVVLHRVPVDRYGLNLIIHVRRRGGVVLFDTDDLVFDGLVAIRFK